MLVEDLVSKDIVTCVCLCFSNTIVRIVSSFNFLQDEDLKKLLNTLTSESVIEVVGKVLLRPKDNIINHVGTLLMIV